MVRRKQVHIRKAKACFGCEVKWAAGSLMEADTTSDDGRIYTNYLCGRCQEARDTLSYDEDYGQGELKDLWLHCIEGPE